MGLKAQDNLDLTIEDILSYEPEYLKKELPIIKGKQVAFSVLLNNLSDDSITKVSHLAVKPLRNLDGFYLSIPNGQYQINDVTLKNFGNPICKDGMVSSDTYVFDFSHDNSLEYKYFVVVVVVAICSYLSRCLQLISVGSKSTGTCNEEGLHKHC
ncbi:hypothetical protein ACWXWU_14880 [Shewanella sp. A14]